MKKRTVKRKPVTRKRRRLSGTSSLAGRRKRYTRKRGMLSGATGDLLGLALGGVLTGLVDKPLSGIGPLKDEKIRSAAKAALGYFLSQRPGMIGNIGKGMIAVSAMQLAKSLSPGTLGESIPSLISDNMSIDVPSLIGDEMGAYEADEIGAYEADEIGDEFGEDDDDLSGDDDDDLSGDDDDLSGDDGEFGDEFGQLGI
ncbi:MAG: hypothetical protein EBR67_10775 [Proteobacteria bacterium]|nr:hypothetical protein [Pseudomonadota bacterium]